MKTIIEGNHEFEIVESIPSDYVIWNIEFIDGYIPLCQLYNKNGIGMFDVRTETLKAFKFENEEERKILKKCVMWGGSSPRECKKYIKRYSKSKKAHTLAKIELYKKGLEVMKKMKGWEKK
ncbi:hypothetical protein ACWG0P_13980 [Amedibacillus sp. YH-ame6]